MSALEEQKNEVRPLSQRPPTARPPADARSPSCSQRLSTKTNLKLAKLWLDRHEYARLNKVRPPRSGPLPLAQLAHAPPSRSQILKELHAQCAPSDDGADVDSSKGTTQLEVYALEIQMYGEMKNNKKLREIYEKSLRVRSAIPHPRIQGVIRECGGKMYMSESVSSLPLLVLLLLGVVVVAVDSSDPSPHPPSLSRSVSRARRGLGQGADRLLRGVQGLRRGRLAAAHPGPQVPRPRPHAHRERHRPVRQPGDQAVRRLFSSLLRVHCFSRCRRWPGKLGDLTRSSSSAGTRTTARSRP